MELISSANGMSPAWSPDGERIAFLSNRAEGWDLYIAPSAGGEPRRLTSGAVADDPAWHPNSGAIAVERRGGIELVQADGSGRELLVEHGAQPAWARDGRLAFVRAGDLWLRSTDGGETALLVDAAEPAWSPDGRAIAVARHGGIEALDPTSGQTRRLADQPGDASPAWSNRSAGGEQIAFVRRGAIWTIDADGGEASPLAGIPSPAGGPAYAPDSTGQTLACHIHQAGNWNVAIAHLESGALRLLTEANWISWDARA